MHIQARNIFTLIALFTGLAIRAQNGNLNLTLVDQGDVTSSDARARFDQLIADIKQNAPDFNYSKITYKSKGYYDPADFMVSTIGTMRAANFILCNQKLQHPLIPIFIVKKNNQLEPYYDGYFIVNKSAHIDSLNSSQIKKIYYGDKRSGSGYFAPLHELWVAGVIRKPSLQWAIDKFGPENVIAASDHQNVIDLVSRDNTFSSIGFSGEVPDSTSNAKVLLKYTVIPQDVIFITEDLERFKPQISAWIKEHVQAGLFANTSTRITGVENFGDEQTAAYQNLGKIISRVQFSENNKTSRNLNFADLGTSSGLFSLIFDSSLTIAERVSLFTGIFAIFSLGITIGLKYPKIVQAVKGDKA